MSAVTWFLYLNTNNRRLSVVLHGGKITNVELKTKPTTSSGYHWSRLSRTVSHIQSKGCSNIQLFIRRIVWLESLTWLHRNCKLLVWISSWLTDNRLTFSFSSFQTFVRLRVGRRLRQWSVCLDCWPFFTYPEVCGKINGCLNCTLQVEPPLPLL